MNNVYSDSVLYITQKLLLDLINEKEQNTCN